MAYQRVMGRGSDGTQNMLIFDNYDQSSPQLKQRGMSDGHSKRIKSRKRKSKKKSEAKAETTRRKKKIFATKLVFYTIRNIMWKRAWQNIKNLNDSRLNYKKERNFNIIRSFSRENLNSHK